MSAPTTTQLSAREMLDLKATATFVMYDEPEPGQLVMLAHREEEDGRYRVRMMVWDDATNQAYTLFEDRRNLTYVRAVQAMANQMAEERG